MKTYVTDVHFESAPDPQTLRRATASAFDVPVGRVATGWFLADRVTMERAWQAHRVAAGQPGN